LNDEGRVGAPPVGFRAVLEAGSDPRRIHFLKGVVPGAGATSSSDGADGLHPANGADADRERIAAVLEAAGPVPARLKLAIEVHSVSLQNGHDLAHWIAGEASKRAITPSRLIAEILESPDAPLDARLDRALHGLRNLGMRIALGRVKLGSAVFKQVRTYRPEYLVLGNDFCENCHGSYFRRAALASLASLAEGCGCRVVARGVRTGADLAAVMAAGIDLIEEDTLLDPETADFG
jgi:EAL domain-containing protein (putative c-di-GMP-specific phosphodiesterase class I)